MEFLKWVGSILLSIIGISVFIGGGLVLSAIGAVLSTAFFAVLGIIVVAIGIKEWFDHDKHRDD